MTNLTADFPTADFNGADVSFDATTVVFSMKKDSSDNYHIYTVSLTPGATGKYEVHQLTAGAQDDFNPIWLPGGVIAFATNEMYTAMGTRADEYEHSRIVSQLATISQSGGDADRHLFPQSLSHSVSLFARHDGKLGYSRWEHLGGTNDVKLFTANPDGTKMIAVAGQHGKPSNSLISVRESAPNVMIGIATNRERTIHAGALVQIDARNTSDPVCMTATAANDQTSGHACLDEEHALFTVLTPDVPTSDDPSPVGRYREPTPLPDGRILTSWAPGFVNDLNELSATPPDFGIYIFDPATQTNQLIYNDEKTWDLNAMAVVPRAEPPVLGSTQTAVSNTDPVLLGSVDIRQTSLEETVQGAEFVQGVSLASALHEAVAVRLIEGFSSEAAKGVTKFGLTMDEGAAVLGTAPVYSDGSWFAKVPPYIPSTSSRSINSASRSATNASGSRALRVKIAVASVATSHARARASPALGANPTVAEQQGSHIPEFTEAISSRTEYPWAGAPEAAKNVQTLLTAKCASCHNSETTTYYSVAMTDPVSGKQTVYHVPTLDLTDTPVTVYYDKGVTTWPASYVSIFYPATLSMGGMMGPKLVSGVIPPMWGIPEDARNSVLIQKINVAAEDGTKAWPSQGFHPEDQGSSFSLTADERQMLIRTMDLGGQYWARQNTGFVPFNHDPTGG